MATDDEKLKKLRRKADETWGALKAAQIAHRAARAAWDVAYDALNAACARQEKKKKGGD